MSPLRFWVAFTMPAALVASGSVGGFAWLAVPILVFVLLPVVDAASGDEPHQPPDDHTAPDWRFDLPLRVWAPIQIGAMVWLVARAPSLGLAEGVAAALACGVVTGGGGITVAHELMHRRAAVDRGLAEVLMNLVGYPWFCVEHVLGHHRTVATRADPAFAARGTTLYGFLPRTLIGGLRSAWRLETDRVARRPGWLGDRRWRWLLGPAAVAGVAAALGGLPGVSLWLGQAIVAVTLLEAINYVEHYGLERATGPDGRPVRVGPEHSWNTPARVTNAWLFNLQRHADHHAHAARPYHSLRTVPGAPTLPAGYPTMLLVAAIPPVWFRTLDPRLDRRSRPEPTLIEGRPTP